MKLGRATAVAAATVVVVPLALFTAPAAFAEAPVPAPSRSAVEQAPGSGTTASPDATGTPATDATDATGEPGATATPGGAGQPGAGAAPEGLGAVEAAEPRGGGLLPSGDSPACEAWQVDKGLPTRVTGLPARYVSGSGWDEFRLTVTNSTGKELEKLWLESYIWLGSAEIQFRHDGAWTDRAQYPGETSSFSAVAQDVAPGEEIVADLRVRVRAGVASDESFAQADATYQGPDGTCYGTGSMHEFVVVPAGTATPTPTATPSATGKPTSAPDGGEDDRTEPQGGAATPTPGPTGSLAATGAGAVLPTTATAGGAAVVLGAAAVFAARRKRTAGQH